MLHLRGSVAYHIQPLPPTPVVLSTSVPATAWQEGVGTFNATGPIASSSVPRDIVAGLEAYRLPLCCVRLALTGRARGVAQCLPGGPSSCTR